MSSRRRYGGATIIACIVFVLSSTLYAQVQGTQVVSAGATEVSAGGVVVRGTVGQSVIGVVQGVGQSVSQGFWYGSWTNISTGVTEEEIVKEKGNGLMLACYPNPVSNNTRFHFSLPQGTNISLRLFNSLGQEVAILFDGEYHIGRGELDVDMGQFDAGYYRAELQSGVNRQTLQVIVTR